MEFEWDVDKRSANIERHGIDFLDARTIWRGPVLDPIALRLVDEEAPMTASGTLGEDEIIIAVVYTLRETSLRLIGASKAE